MTRASSNFRWRCRLHPRRPVNFANVFGRYILGYSLLGTDKVDLIMVAMTFVRVRNTFHVYCLLR